MKLLHLADLHLGKRVYAFSMIEDQRYILKQILDIAAEEKPDAVLISGDVYDKLTPPAEAVTLLDDFLSELANRQVKVYMTAGNHDSAERLAFGSRIMNKSGVYLSQVYNGKAARFTLSDEWGELDIYALPYLREAEVKRFFPEAEITDTDSALRTAISALNVDFSRRNIILSHQFVEGGLSCESERSSVGGTDQVSFENYAPFEYAALGHLHTPQYVEREHIRYSGTPLKYSFSEAMDEKSVTVCNIGPKGEAVQIFTRKLKPLRDMRVLTGSFDELMQGESDDYLKISLTNNSRVPDALLRLRTRYPNIMLLEYAREPERQNFTPERKVDIKGTDPLDIFSSFYTETNGKPMTDDQRDFMASLINMIWTNGGDI